MQVQTANSYNMGVLFTTQRMIEDIATKSGQLAISNEYQVHYNSVVFRLSSDTEFIDIAVPTVVFNYPQEVSSAAIAFELKDVQSMIQKAAPLTESMTGFAISKFKPVINKFANKLGLTVTVHKEQLSNIHRHPGSLASFSGTDYDTNTKNPGIVFPLDTAKNTPIFSSIILHNPVRLAHTEYRLVNTVDNVTTYYKGACYTFTKGYTVNIPSLYKAITETSDNVKSSYTEPATLPTLISELFAMFETIDYEPSTHLVIADNLEAKKAFTYNPYTYTGSTIDTAKKSKHKPHVGALPLLATLIRREELYRNTIFTTAHGKYLGGDIIEAYEFIADEEVEENVKFINRKELTTMTINQFLDRLVEYEILEIYIEPYEEKETELEVKTNHWKQERLSYLEDEDDYPTWSYSAKYPATINRR